MQEESEREPLQAVNGHGSHNTSSPQPSSGPLPTLSAVRLLEIPVESSSVREDDGEASFYDCESVAGED